MLPTLMVILPFAMLVLIRCWFPQEKKLIGEFQSIGVNVVKHRDGTIIRFNTRFTLECVRDNRRATFYIEGGVGVTYVSLTSIKVFDLDGNRVCVSEEEKEKWNQYVKGALKYSGIKAEYD